MTNLIQIINAICSGENSRSRALLRYRSVVIALAFALFAVPLTARAVCQEGCLTDENTVLGEDALLSLTTGTENVALGYDALQNTTAGLNNTATGHSALASNTVGFNNTGLGWHAALITTGNSNTAVGCDALNGNTTGSENIAMGHRAGINLTTGVNNIDIGNNGVVGESNAIRIGAAGAQNATFVAGIRGVAIAGAQPVGVNAAGQLVVRASAARFKEAISSMDKASEAILALKPVTFRYKHELDPDGIPQFGLVAEQVEKVNPDLVARDDLGKAYTVRYEAVNAMLLNEFLKEHREVQEQKATII
jgi:Chaperone of endosialidase